MNKQRLDEIRAKAKKATEEEIEAHISHMQSDAHEDIPFLLSYIEKLEAVVGHARKVSACLDATPRIPPAILTVMLLAESIKKLDAPTKDGKASTQGGK